MCYTVIREIKHADGGQTLICDDGSRIEVLPGILIEGQVARGESSERRIVNLPRLRGTMRPSDESPGSRGTEGHNREATRPPRYSGGGIQPQNWQLEMAPQRRGPLQRQPASEPRLDAPPRPAPPDPSARIHPDRGRRLPPGRLNVAEQRILQAFLDKLKRWARRTEATLRLHKFLPTMAIMEIVDANGRYRQEVIGYFSRQGEHAEERAHRLIRRHLESGRYRGGRLRVFVTQEPCSTAGHRCDLLLRRLAQEHGLLVETYVPHMRRGSDQRLSPKTSLRLWLDGQGELELWNHEHHSYDFRQIPTRSSRQRGGRHGEREGDEGSQAGRSPRNRSDVSRRVRPRQGEGQPRFDEPYTPPRAFRTAPDPAPLLRIGINIAANVVADLFHGLFWGAVDAHLREQNRLSVIPEEERLQRIQRRREMEDVDGQNLVQFLVDELPRTTSQLLARHNNLAHLIRNFRAYRQSLIPNLQRGLAQINRLPEHQDRAFEFGELVVYFYDEQLALEDALSEIDAALQNEPELLARAQEATKARDALRPWLLLAAGRGWLDPTEVVYPALRNLHVYIECHRNLPRRLRELRQMVSDAISMDRFLQQGLDRAVDRGRIDAEFEQSLLTFSAMQGIYRRPSR